MQVIRFSCMMHWTSKISKQNDAWNMGGCVREGMGRVLQKSWSWQSPAWAWDGFWCLFVAWIWDLGFGFGIWEHLVSPVEVVSPYWWSLLKESKPLFWHPNNKVLFLRYLCLGINARNWGIVIKTPSFVLEPAEIPWEGSQLLPSAWTLRTPGVLQAASEPQWYFSCYIP